MMGENDAHVPSHEPGSSSESAAQVRVVRHGSIREIDEVLWDSINLKQDLFHSHRFIRSLEDANVESSRFWYLLFYQNGVPVATAVLSSFRVSLDLLMTGLALGFVDRLRSWFPSLLKVEILFCGLPISIGKHALTLSDPSLSDTVLDLLVREMTEISRQHGIRLLCAKEFLEEETPTTDRFTRHHFLRRKSLPAMTLKIRWPDFSSYLRAMRHPYRRHILRSLKKLDLTEPTILTDPGHHQHPGKPALVLADSRTSSPRRFHEMYLNVMEHAGTKLETLNGAFFDHLYRNLDREMAVLSVTKGEQILATSLVTFCGSTMTFLLSGLDYATRDNHDAYFNLVYGMVALAIRRGYSRIDLGQTAYWVKQCAGAESRSVYFYLRAERWYVNRLLKMSRWLLFPEIELPSPRVFRE